MRRRMPQRKMIRKKQKKDEKKDKIDSKISNREVTPKSAIPKPTSDVKVVKETTETKEQSKKAPEIKTKKTKTQGGKKVDVTTKIHDSETTTLKPEPEVKVKVDEKVVVMKPDGETKKKEPKEEPKDISREKSASYRAALPMVAASLAFFACA